jgi:hypothetical protein
MKPRKNNPRRKTTRAVLISMRPLASMASGVVGERRDDADAEAHAYVRLDDVRIGGGDRHIGTQPFAPERNLQG